MPLLFALLTIAAAAQSPRTLTLDLRPDGSNRARRPMSECQWAASDLTLDETPDFANAGTGAVLRLTPNPRVKTFGKNRKTKWEKIARLTAYANDPRKYILERYRHLDEVHHKRCYFYETEENLRRLLATGEGFELEPGTLVVGDGDAALMRRLFAAPAFEFIVLEKVEVDGVTVYRPTGRAGALPMEVVAKSARVVFGQGIPTLTKMYADAKAARCKTALDGE